MRRRRQRRPRRASQHEPRPVFALEQEREVRAAPLADPLGTELHRAEAVLVEEPAHACRGSAAAGARRCPPGRSCHHPHVRTLLSGGAFFESPRWHDGPLVGLGLLPAARARGRRSRPRRGGRAGRGDAVGPRLAPGRLVARRLDARPARAAPDGDGGLARARRSVASCATGTPTTWWSRRTAARTSATSASTSGRERATRDGARARRDGRDGHARCGRAALPERLRAGGRRSSARRGRDVGRTADRVRRRRRRRRSRTPHLRGRPAEPRRTAARSMPRAVSGSPTRAATGACALRGGARSATRSRCPTAYAASPACSAAKTAGRWRSARPRATTRTSRATRPSSRPASPCRTRAGPSAARRRR